MNFPQQFWKCMAPAHDNQTSAKIAVQACGAAGTTLFSAIILLQLQQKLCVVDCQSFALLNT
jgi:hypothetical protein